MGRPTQSCSSRCSSALKVGSASQRRAPRFQPLVRRDQRLGHVAPAERPVAATLIGETTRQQRIERLGAIYSVLASISYAPVQRPEPSARTQGSFPDSCARWRRFHPARYVDAKGPHGAHRGRHIVHLQPAGEDQLAFRRARRRGLAPIGQLAPLPLRAPSNSSAPARQFAGGATQRTGRAATAAAAAAAARRSGQVRPAAYPARSRERSHRPRAAKGAASRQPGRSARARAPPVTQPAPAPAGAPKAQTRSRSRQRAPPAPPRPPRHS